MKAHDDMKITNHNDYLEDFDFKGDSYLIWSLSLEFVANELPFDSAFKDQMF